MMKFVQFLSVFSLAALATVSASAADYAAVNKESCYRFEKSTSPFMLVLKSGDDILSSITQCAKDAKLQAASFTGIGQLHNPTLAYFTSNPQDKPMLKTFGGYYELVSLTGDVTNNKGNYYTHAHVALGDHAFQGIAGHLKSGEVGMTAEITISPLDAPLERTINANSGFGPIVTK